MQVVQILTDQGHLEQAGGKIALMGLLDEVVTAAPVMDYAKVVADKWKRRRLGMLASKMAALQHDAQPWEVISSQLEADLFALVANQNARGLRGIDEILTECAAEAEQRSQQKTLPGMPTGFRDLDTMTTGGFHSGDLIVCAGRPGMGKTAWSLQVGRFIASNNRKPVAMFSMEMGDKQLTARLWGAEASIEASRLKNGRLSEAEWAEAYQKANTLAALPLHIDESFNPSIAHIRTQCRKLIARQGEMGLVLIDYLQLMDSGEGQNRVQELSTITRRLKMLARELNCPVLLLSQLNRGVESRTNKRPLMADLRDSGCIEQDADLILMLYREDYYEDDTPNRGLVEVIVAKNRNGPTGTVKLLFEPEFTRFRSLPHSA
jgi:replicative DNA helicase